VQVEAAEPGGRRDPGAARRWCPNCSTTSSGGELAVARPGPTRIRSVAPAIRRQHGRRRRGDALPSWARPPEPVVAGPVRRPGPGRCVAQRVGRGAPAGTGDRSSTEAGSFAGSSGPPGGGNSWRPDIGDCRPVAPDHRPNSDAPARAVVPDRVSRAHHCAESAAGRNFLEDLKSHCISGGMADLRELVSRRHLTTSAPRARCVSRDVTPVDPHRPLDRPGPLTDVTAPRSELCRTEHAQP